ncbi:efflux RND transporter permease subunit [Flavisphingomonas formosensis]|uniref:efflux RND transporter permease subunit n=1 Tax=Flavisphingomonas formosensis TaxID=861534 RepID=UPI0012FA847E|nr:efflux RND transporter permease subunit [Sphingomonas formosensis]
MAFRNISAWSIRNPVPAIVLFVALTLAGLVSFMRMQVNQQPDISFPAAEVIVQQPGAAPTELETQVTQRIEAAVRSISGVNEMSSYVSEGQSRTFVQFTIGTPVDRAVNDVRNAVSQVRSELPEGILEPQINRVDIDGGPMSYMSVEAVDMTLEQLSWYVDNTVAKTLLGIEGMAQVQRGGGVSREIRVILDPIKMQAQGITAAEVNAQLRLTNLNAAGGRAEIAGAEQSVRVLGNARNAYDLSQQQITVGGGRTIKLSEIADVRDLYAEQRHLGKMGGRQVLSFSMVKAKGASDVTVYRAAKKALDKLQKENPKIRFTELFNSVQYTESQYHAAMSAMVEGAVLAVIVVFLFLRDWRAMAISAMAIPLSAIPTFWFMDLLGFTLNGVSLLALSLVAGVLVDDAIVEIENIVRHMRMGKSAYQASIDAADEIGLAVVATTMSIVAVFLPVGLMPGVSGQFFKQFGLTVVIAVLISLAVARLITPMVAAYFLKAHGEAPHGSGPLMDLYMKVLHWSLDDSRAREIRNRPVWAAMAAQHPRSGMWQARVRSQRFVRSKLADHRVWTMGIAFLAFLATIAAFSTLSFTFQPTLNVDYSQVNVELAPGATLRQTEQVADKVTAVLRQAPEVSQAFEDIEVGKATVYLTLKADRKRKSVEFERAMQPKLAAIPDARIAFQSQAGGIGGRDLTVMLASDEPNKLNQTALDLVTQMRALPELRAPRIDGDLQRPEITIHPRFDLAADMGVTTAALSQTIRIATLGDIDQNVAKFSLSDRQIPIRVAIREDARRDLSTIQNLPVPTAAGGSVPLKVVADIGLGAGPTELRRYGQKRRIVIGADLAPGVVSGQAMKKINALPALTQMPTGVERVSFGDDKIAAEMISNFVIAVISGIFLVFAVLVLLYKRVMPPMVNMGSLLLAPLGGALALHLVGMPISMPVLIGLLMLFGIVAKNSILLVDFAIEEMSQGREKLEAILDAGHKRAQPIVMTTVAMVAGMVPTALALSGDGSFNAPMGITVIGGLLLSTLLTLVIVPASFSLADSFEKWLGPKLGRFLNDDSRTHHAPQPAE